MGLMVQPNPLPVAVLGAGRMGGHHARVYAASESARLAGVVDADPERGQALAGKHKCPAFERVDALLAAEPELAAVSVAVPTSAHEAATTPLLERGIACLVEKPLAPDSAGARRLADVAARTGTPLQAGHTERFNPAVRGVLEMGVTPRFLQVERVSPMSFRSLDISVVLDLMIHDLDIVLTLSGERLEEVRATGVAALGFHEDVANARLVFPSGCVATLTASRLALKSERSMRLFSEDAYVSLDYQRQRSTVVRRSDNEEALRRVRERVQNGEDLSALDYKDLVRVQRLGMGGRGEKDPLTAELSSFLRAVAEGAPPSVDAEAGCTAIEAAERVTEAVRAHTWEGLDRDALAPTPPPTH